MAAEWDFYAVEGWNGMSPANKDEREGQTRKVDRSKFIAGLAVSDHGRGSEQLGGGCQAQWSTGARGTELQQWT